MLSVLARQRHACASLSRRLDLPSTWLGSCRRRLASLVVLAAIAGCHADPVTPVLVSAAETMQVQRDPVSAMYVPAGVPTAAQPAVTVRDARGAPVGQVPVEFRVTDAAGGLERVSVRSDVAGRAALPLLLPRVPGPVDVEVQVGRAAPVHVALLALPATLLDGPVARQCALVSREVKPFRGVERSVAALRDGRPLRIVALGSSSTSGYGLDDWGFAFPYRLGDQLRRVFPQREVVIVNAGHAGHTAAQLDERLERDVLSQEPDLVVLQTGTNDAVQRLPLDVVKAVTLRTVRRLQARGVDVVLLDPQRMPGLGETDAYRRYVTLLDEVADETGSSVAGRYQWMSAVLAAGELGWRDLLLADDTHHTRRGHECTAHLITMGLTASLFARRP